MDEVEVEITDGKGGKAIIEGKTSVPFKTFVSLILQRKVQAIFKTCQDEPVIVSSELLTSLASAPNDRQEDKAKLVLVTMGAGTLVGVFLTIALFVAFMLFDVRPEMKDLLIALGILLLVAVVVGLLMSSQKKAGFKEKLYESMEKVTDLIAR